MIKWFFRIILVIFLGVVIFEKLTRFLVQKYQFNLVIGKVGSGKSVMYTQLAHYYLSRGYCVYGTEDITVYVKDKKTRTQNPVQVKKVKADQLYRYKFPKDSVVLIDEIGTIFPARGYKEFSKKNITWWKRYRHNQLIIWAWSQSFDCDLILRNLVTQFWILERKFRIFAVARRLVMKPVVVHPQGEGVARITDDFVEDPKIMRPVLGGSRWIYIPRWIQHYDSYEIPEEISSLVEIDWSDDEPPYLPKKIYSARREKMRLWFDEQIMKMRVAYYVVISKLRK